MIKDPKQIVTPYAFSVHPDILGLPLATPKRRLAALLIDLLIASILTGLGNLFLAFGVTILFFWIAVRTKSESMFKNLLRYSGAAVASIFVFSISVGVLEIFDLGDSDETPDPVVTINGTEQVDWSEFGARMATMDYSDPEALEQGLEELAEQLDSNNNESSNSAFLDEISDTFPTVLSDFRMAISNGDTSLVDSLRSEIAAIVAAKEIEQFDDEIDALEDQVSDLEDENEELTDQIENPSLYATLKRGFGFLGLSLGWIGIYFITTIAFFRGQTLGKRLLNIRVVRLNNNPIGLFFAFERFGGYAAGIATGLIGFFQMFWDANRQAIHDKIAGTVVIDLRESKMKKTEEMRNEILESENLLSQF